MGVEFPNDADISRLAPTSAALRWSCLEFPGTDGRAYTQAHEARARFKFKGAIRARRRVFWSTLMAVAAAHRLQ